VWVHYHQALGRYEAALVQWQERQEPAVTEEPEEPG
jgi:hypothetical protein